MRPRIRTVLVAALTGAAFLLPAGCGSPAHQVPEADDDPGPAALAPPTPSLSETPEPAWTVDRTLLGRQGTLDGALERLRLDTETRVRVAGALASRLDLRRLPPETGLSVARDADAAPVRIACRAAPDRYVEVSLDGKETPVAEELAVPVRRTAEATAGVVSSTVAQALDHHREGTALTLAFADIFQWDVDLFVDPRPGDVVRLVYESLHLDDPPAHLPGFGTTEIDHGAILGIGRVLAASYEGERARSIAFWIDGDGRGGTYYDEHGRSLRKTFLKSPLNYRRISSSFTRRRRHPITRKVVPHHGVDFVAAPGTPVVAAADGRIVSAGWSGALGKAIRIRHGNSYASIYGHLRSFARGIRAGARVEQNQVIGYVGSTGRATGPHLHYTLQHHGRAINPMTFDNPPVEPLDQTLRPRLEEVKQAWLPALGSAEPGIATAVVTRPPSHAAAGGS